MENKFKSHIIFEFQECFPNDEACPEKNAEIKTDKWRGYKTLRSDFPNLRQVESGKKGKNSPDLYRTIMNFKGWLRGIHHYVDYLQQYIDEYCYRFNRSTMSDGIFDKQPAQTYGCSRKQYGVSA